MTHTLTAFMELMDHGIVSWENLSSVFIKKVPDLLFPSWKLMFLPSLSPTSCCPHCFPRSLASLMPNLPMPPYSRCPWTSWRAWC